MNAYPFVAEVRLIRWGESSSAGRTITLEIPPGGDDAHPFRGFPTGHQHGQRFLMSFQPIDDNEQTVSRDPGETRASRRPEEALHPPEGQRSLSPTPPAGAHHTKDPQRSMRAKEHYASLDERERAVADAGRFANDTEFQRFVSRRSGQPPSVELAEYVIRDECGVISRAEIAHSDKAFKAWGVLLTEFEIATGRRAAPR